MDLFLLYSLVVGFFFITLFSLLRQWHHHSKLPPGTTGWPLIGETLVFLSAGWKGKPERFIMDRMSRFSSVCFRTSLIAEDMVVMCGPQGNKFLFSNENKLVASWVTASMKKILFSSSGESICKENIKVIRDTFLRFFKPEALQGYVMVMDSVAIKHFADFWENKQEILVHPLAKMYTFSVGCKLLLGIEDPSHIARMALNMDHVITGFISMPINLPGTRLNRAIKCARLIREEIKELIRKRKIELAEKKATPTQDILSMMIKEQEMSINEEEIAEKIQSLLIGSHDTVGSAITFIVKYLAELPHVYNQVYEEQMEIAMSKAEGELLTWTDIKRMKCSWNVACEVMRLVPPAIGSFREAVQDFTFAGFQIPKGFKLHGTPYSTHYNPDHFPNPEKFDASRFEGEGPAPYTYTPFGGGPRMCPGMEFTRLDILVFIHNIVKRFKWEKLVADEKLIVMTVAVPEKGLPIRILPHKS